MPRESGSLPAIIIVPLALLMLAVAIFAYRSAAELQESREVVNATNGVLEETQELLILAQAAETSQRGYVLTGDEQYLSPFRDAETKVPQTVESLRELLAGQPGQIVRLNSLNGYLQLKFRELNDTIDTRRAKGFDAARAIVLNNTGQAAMISIRNLVGEMTVAEQTLLEQRLGEYRLAEHRTFLVTGALFAGLLLLSIGGGYILLRNFDRLVRTENELEIKARLLQATLDTVAEGIGAFDGSQRLVASNRRFFDIFGLPPPPAGAAFTLPDLIELDSASGGNFAAMADLPASHERPAYGVFERKQRRTLEVAKNLMTGGGIVFTTRDITEKLTAESALHQAQKMETVGQLTGGVAHDFNNLLQIIIANLDLALRQVEDPTIQKRLKEAIVGAERGSKLTRQLLAFARRQPLKPEPVNLGRLVRELTDLLRRTLGESIEIEETAAAGLWDAMVDRSQLENAIVNLAINARDAMPNGGRLTLESGNAFLDEEYSRAHDGIQPGQYVMIAVTDTGIGMSRDVMSRAFDPFFSTKPEGKGTGLGLSMVYGFARQSGGHAKIYSEPGVGTTVKIYLPRSMQGEKVQVVVPVDTITGHGETILVVEDESNVRAAVLLILQDIGYRTLEAANGQAALDILKSGAAVDLMFTDVVMPGEIQGRRLAQEAAKIRPDLPIVFTSGYTENSIIHHGRLDDGVHLLSKPYRKEDLARKLRSVLGEPGPAVPTEPPQDAAPPPVTEAAPPAPVIETPPPVPPPVSETPSPKPAADTAAPAPAEKTPTATPASKKAPSPADKAALFSAPPRREPRTAPPATVAAPNPAADLSRGADILEQCAVNIVFVEDDPLVQMATVDMLEVLGHTVSAVRDQPSAIEALKQGKADVLIVDVNLGSGDGRELAREARRLFPELKIVFATGRDPGDLQTIVPGSRLLGKPYGLPELRQLFTSLFPV